MGNWLADGGTFDGYVKKNIGQISISNNNNNSAPFSGAPKSPTIIICHDCQSDLCRGATISSDMQMRRREEWRRIKLKLGGDKKSSGGRGMNNIILCLCGHDGSLRLSHRR